MKNFLLYLWQLPQNILGLIVIFCTKAEKKDYYIFKKYYITRKNLGVSLGNYIIIYMVYNQKDLMHEYGHQKQSLILGPLYLLIVGIPSAIHNLISRKTNCNYYHFWTEKWADKLGGVNR